VYTQRIRNYTAKPIEVEVRRTFPGHVTFRSALDPKLHDYQTVEFRASLKPAAQADLVFEVVRKEGYLAKQNNVTLETAELPEADTLKARQLGDVRGGFSRLPGLTLLAALGSFAGWAAMRML